MGTHHKGASRTGSHRMATVGHASTGRMDAVHENTRHFITRRMDPGHQDTRHASTGRTNAGHQDTGHASTRRMDPGHENTRHARPGSGALRGSRRHWPAHTGGRTPWSPDLRGSAHRRPHIAPPGASSRSAAW